MSYEVLARKWRPKNFSELIGQSSVEQTLSNALKNNRLYPVLLFTGPRGTGKTSTARILAKSLRCSHQKKLLPCDRCEDCLLIQDSRHLDVIEIDGASNNGVDAVRELRESVSYMPSTGYWKIYIIDEVHMLSNSAFNALLKTFEEPPKHVIFIMATTEIRKIPKTILSRSQKMDFHLLSPALIKKHLENICKEEKLSVPEEVLWMTAKQARGSLRDAQSFLDQIITFCGREVHSEKVAELLGLSDPQIVFQCLKSLIQRKEEEMISVIENLRVKGSDPLLFLQSLVELLAQLLFLKKNPENDPPLVQASSQDIQQMKAIMEAIDYEDIHFLFDMLLKGEREMAFCHDSHLLLEVLLLRFCGAPRLESISPLNPLSSREGEDKKTIEKSSNGKSAPGPEVKKPLNGKSAPGPEVKKPLNGKSAPGPEIKKPLFSPNKKPEPTVADTPPLKPASEGKEFFDRSLDFLDFLQKKDSTLAALVENLSLKQKAKDRISFVFPQNSYIKSKMSDPLVRKILEEKINEFLNAPYRVKIEFSEALKGESSLREERATKEEQELLSKAKSSSFVNEVADLFEGKIKSVTKSSP